ncbi:MAG TPA: protease pro-enzyme activation domain-containing protein, partial [Acidimicrobiales bacterium]
MPPGATPIGPAPATDALPLVVTLQPRDPAALSAYAQAVSDPTSPDFRQFLTPAQFANQFGATPATISSVTTTLRSEGMSVGPPSAIGLSLPVSGTVGQEEAAFSTPITKYKLSSGKTGYHNDTEPKVPATVALQIEGVLGLDTLTPPKPQTTVPQASPGVASPGTPAASPALAPNQPTPTGSSCTTTINGLRADGALDAPDLAQAYSFGSLYNGGNYGSGTTIALLEMYGAGYSSGDVKAFADCYGITPDGSQVSEINVSSGDGAGTQGGGTVESELDIDTALSLAPKANIEVYEGGTNDSIYSVFSAIVSQDTAKIVSASWTNGCEAYVPASVQSSENTVLQAAATEGQSVFVAAGDQGSEGCNVNGVTSAAAGNDPVAQAVDPSTGTLYIANQGDNTVTVDGEGDGGNNTTASSVSTGSAPDAVALDATDQKVFVANRSSSSLTVFPSSTCDDTITSGCGSTTTISSGGDLSSPRALAVSGSTLYVANGTGTTRTVAVYNASTNGFVTSVTLPSGTVPTALSVDATNGVVYVADGSNGRVEYFSATTCNASTTSGCSGTPSTVSVGTDPVALVVDASAGGLYVANGGGAGGVSVVSLSTHAVTATISTGNPSVPGLFGAATVESIGLSPDGKEVLAILHGLTFPGDVMATINTSTNTLAATANLQTGGDTMGQLVSDGSNGRDYVWVTDETSATAGD